MKGNNNDDDAPPPPDGRRPTRHHGDLLRKRFSMEPKIVKDFEVVLVSDLGGLDKWEIIDKEREVVWKLLRSAGAMEGFAAFAFTFLGMNRLPRYLARRAARKQPQQARHSYVLEKPVGKQQQQQSPFQAPDKAMVEKRVTRSRNRFVFTTMELMFDTGMSLGVGVTVAFLASDENEAKKTFVEIPLQPGRSFISEQICDNLLQEYQRQWKKNADTRHVLQEPHHNALQIMKALAQNCRHRQVMEQQLRDDQGLQSSITTPVLIPDTGVRPFSDDPLLDMMMLQGGSDDSTSAVTTTEFSEQGVASFVQDQEEGQS